MINRAQLDAYRNTFLCDVHQSAWTEILDTIDALLNVAEAADDIVEKYGWRKSAVVREEQVLINVLAAIKQPGKETPR